MYNALFSTQLQWKGTEASKDWTDSIHEYNSMIQSKRLKSAWDESCLFFPTVTYIQVKCLLEQEKKNGGHYFVQREMIG